MPEKLTILTAPKPFTDTHISMIQRNAIRSWKMLGGEVRIIVLGDDPGIAETAAVMGLDHIPNVRCNEKGTPLVSSMLDLARKSCRSPFLAIVNADIILFPDILNALDRISEKFQKFLIIGQRWDLDVVREIPQKDNAFTELKKEVSDKATLHPPMGSDYFVFPRECYQDVPDFAIGRAGWDNWFIFKSRFEGWPVVDATHGVTIVHQTHDYRHLPGGRPHYRLPETRKNVALGGGDFTIFTIGDSQFEIQDENIVKKKRTFKKIFREMEIFPLTVLRSEIIGKTFFYVFHPKKLYRKIRGDFKI